MAVLFSSFGLANNLTFESSNKPLKTVTFEELKRMPPVTYTTHLPWVKGEVEFTGVSLTVLLNDGFGEIPEVVTFRALNDYSIEIAKEDIEKYKPIIAYLKEGKQMAIRDKGPYWVIYSLSDFPELDKSQYHSQMIWQLAKIQINVL